MTWDLRRIGAAFAVVFGLSACESEVNVEPSGGAPGGGTSDEDAAALVKEKCPNIAAQPHYCVTVSLGGWIRALGPDTGDTCDLGQIDLSGATDLSSIAVLGTKIHGASYGLGVFRAEITGGPVEVVSVEATAITEYQGGLLLDATSNPSALEHHTSFATIKSNEPLALLSIEGQFSRISTRGNTLYTAWHSASLVDVFELPSGVKKGSIQLEGEGDWIFGMSATQDGRIYLVRSGELIAAYDLETGKKLQEIGMSGAPGGSFSGLHCWSN